MTKLTALAVLCLAGTAFSQDLPKDSPELMDKAYEASHLVRKPFEIGTSTFTVSVDCMATEDAAVQAVQKKVNDLKLIVEDAIAKLGAKESKELLGTDFTAKIVPSSGSPMSNVIDAEKKKYFWTNRCDGTKSEQYVRATAVASAKTTFRVWMPNKGQMLNQLTALVKQVEGFTEKGAATPKVSCKSSTGNNFDLDVTESTSKAAWTEVKAVSQKLAKEKVDLDFAKTKYDGIWAINEGFVENQLSQVVHPTEVVNENGTWVAKFKDDKNYTVYFKQAGERDARNPEGTIADRKSYAVSAKAEARTGLYATLSFTVVRNCADSQAQGEKDVTATAEAIQEELRKFNKGQNSDTDQLVVDAEPSGRSYNPLVGYTQLENGRPVQFYYDGCTLKNYETQYPGEVIAWRGYAKYTVTSSDLTALDKLRTTLNDKYKTVKSEDVKQVVVTSDWKATAVRSVLESTTAKLDADAFEQFLAHGSDYKCDAGKYTVACMSRPAGYGGGLTRGALPESLKEAGAYGAADRAPAVEASERGKKTFVGKYVYLYTLRKVLK